ncbi:Ig-like domain-containing protein [Methanobrevibacter sp.]
MKYKSLIFICAIIFLLGIGGVCASDVNETLTASDAESLSSSVSDVASDDCVKVSSEENDESLLSEDGNDIVSTVLVASDFTTVYKSDDHLQVTLKDDQNNPINNVSLTYDLDGKHTRVTEDGGQIRISTFNLNPNVYNVTIDFKGTKDYAPSSVTVKITVNKADSFLNCSESLDLNVGSTANITAGVIGATGITAKIGDLNVETVGMKILIPKLGVGTHKLVVTTIPEDNYNSVSKTTLITVKKIESSFALHDLALNYGDSSSVTVFPKGATGITAEIDGKAISAKGNEILISGLDAGTHTLSVTTIPDENHTAVTKTVTVTVKKIDSAISIKDVNVDYGTFGNITISYDGATGFTAKIDGENVEVEGDVLKIPVLDAGRYNLAVTTVPDANHNPVTKTSTITVNKVDPQFTVHDATFDYGTKYNMTVDTRDSTKFTAQIDGKNVDVSGSMVIFPVLNVGTHTLTVSSLEDTNHNGLTQTSKITVEKAKTSVVTSKLNATAGEKVNLTAGIGGFEKINEGVAVFYIGESKIGQANVKNGIAKMTYTPKEPGVYSVSVVYEGTASFASSRSAFKLTVLDDSNSSSSSDSNSSGEKNTSVDIKGDTDIFVPYSNANVTLKAILPSDATGNVTFTLNGKSYEFPVVNGTAIIYVPDLDDGNYIYTITYSGDDKYPSATKNGNINKTSPKVDPVVKASNVNAVYAAGTYYNIKVYGTDGKLANGAVVKISGKISKTLKTVNGIAKFKISQVPGTYKITITSLGKSVTRTITVKHLVTLKAVTVKKSAKKLVLQSVLGKINGKYLTKKTVTFKFNGKTYKAKTNSKGVAQVTIKSSVLKKLKVGKKVIYQATYGKDTVKRTAIIKK